MSELDRILEAAAAADRGAEDLHHAVAGFCAATLSLSSSPSPVLGEVLYQVDNLTVGLATWHRNHKSPTLLLLLVYVVTRVEASKTVTPTS